MLLTFCNRARTSRILKSNAVNHLISNLQIYNRVTNLMKPTDDCAPRIDYLLLVHDQCAFHMRSILKTNSKEWSQQRTCWYLISEVHLLCGLPLFVLSERHKYIKVTFFVLPVTPHWFIFKLEAKTLRLHRFKPGSVTVLSLLKIPQRRIICVSVLAILQ